jgi:hypothetical protein
VSGEPEVQGRRPHHSVPEGKHLKVGHVSDREPTEIIKQPDANLGEQLQTEGNNEEQTEGDLVFTHYINAGNTEECPQIKFQTASVE